jgi:SAM-dependent methyltransferase
MLDEAARNALQRRIAAVPGWYQTLALADGVVTPGYRDMRSFVPKFHLPTTMAGMRVLDAPTANGQFAFHFERLGAAHVVAVNLAHVLDHDFPDWYRDELRRRYSPQELARIDHEDLAAGFLLAHDVLQSRVEFRRSTLYELGDRMPGEFDFAFCCNATEHLRDPVRALESIRRALKPGGRFVLGCSCERTVEGAGYAVFHGVTDPHINYWVPSPKAAEQWCRIAGFVDIRVVDSFEWAPVPHPERIAPVVVLHASNRA